MLTPRLAAAQEDCFRTVPAERGRGAVINGLGRRLRDVGPSTRREREREKLRRGRAGLSPSLPPHDRSCAGGCGGPLRPESSASGPSAGLALAALLKSGELQPSANKADEQPIGDSWGDAARLKAAKQQQQQPQEQSASSGSSSSSLSSDLAPRRRLPPPLPRVTAPELQPHDPQLWRRVSATLSSRAASRKVT